MNRIVLSLGTWAGQFRLLHFCCRSTVKVGLGLINFFGGRLFHGFLLSCCVVGLIQDSVRSFGRDVDFVFVELVLDDDLRRTIQSELGDLRWGFYLSAFFCLVTGHDV